MQSKKIQIRETSNYDFENIMKVEEQAFGYIKEAILTAELLNDNTAKPVLSLLAFQDKKAIGHILFTRVYMNIMDKNQPLIHILAPLAIIPEHQNKGIGGMLIKQGLKRLMDMGTNMVFVLGHMEYYPKFGFIPDAAKLGYFAPYFIPEEYKNAWMVQSLNNNKLEIEKGKVLCANALNKPEHWKE